MTAKEFLDSGGELPEGLTYDAGSGKIVNIEVDSVEEADVTEKTSFPQAMSAYPSTPSEAKNIDADAVYYEDGYTASNIIYGLQKSKISYNQVQPLNEKLSEEQIVRRQAGFDHTGGRARHWQWHTLPISTTDMTYSIFVVGKARNFSQRM